MSLYSLPRVSQLIVEALSLWLMVLMPGSKHSRRTQPKTIGRIGQDHSEGYQPQTRL